MIANRWQKLSFEIDLGKSYYLIMREVLQEGIERRGVTAVIQDKYPVSG